MLVYQGVQKTIENNIAMNGRTLSLPEGNVKMEFQGERQWNGSLFNTSLKVNTHNAVINGSRPAGEFSLNFLDRFHDDHRAIHPMSSFWVSLSMGDLQDPKMEGLTVPYGHIL